MTSRENRVEVPGTPEEVWKAIATGPGNAAWFVPAEIEPRVGGVVALDVGTGMVPAGVVTGWDPPRRFAYEEEWGPAARLATEFVVAARSGGTCVVRLVSTVFAESGDWDDELDALHEGWESFLHNLRIYLSEFAGQRSALIAARARMSGPPDVAWAELTERLGVADATRVRFASLCGENRTRIAGVVERAGPRELMIRTEEPGPGVAMLHVVETTGGVEAILRVYLFGDDAAGIAERDEPAWQRSLAASERAA